MASRSPQHSGKTNNISLPTKQICHTNQISSTGRLCYASHRRDSSACRTPTFVTHSAKSSLIPLYNKGAFCRERRQFNLMLNTLNHEVIVVMSCRHDEICTMAYPFIPTSPYMNYTPISKRENHHIQERIHALLPGRGGHGGGIRVIPILTPPPKANQLTVTF